MITLNYLIKLILVAFLASLLIYTFYNNGESDSVFNKSLFQINKKLIEPFITKYDLEWMYELFKSSFLNLFELNDDSTNSLLSDNTTQEETTENQVIVEEEEFNNKECVKKEEISRPFIEKDSRKNVVQPSFATVYSQTPDELYKKIEKDYISYTVEDLEEIKIGSFDSGTYVYDKLIPYIHKNIHPVLRYRTQGTFDNLISLMNGDIDMAFVDENILNNLYKPYQNVYDVQMFINSYNNYKKIKSYLPHLRNVAVLYNQHLFLITKNVDGINDWSDLIQNWKTKNYKIGVTNNFTNSYYHINMLLHANGILINELPNIIKVYLNEERMIKDFKNDKINAIYYTSNFKNKIIQNLTKEEEVRFIGADFNYDKIIPNKSNTYEYEYKKKEFHHKKLPSIYESVLDLNHFYNNKNTSSFIKTYSSRIILITRDDFSDEKVYKFMNNFISHLENIKNN